MKGTKDMKRKLLVLLFCLSAMALMACGSQETIEENNAAAPTTVTEATATPSPSPTVAPTATPSPLPTSTPTPTSAPTSTPTPTATPVPLSYGEENGFVVENKLEYTDLSFAYYVMAEDSYEEAEYPGFTAEPAGYVIGIDSVTKKPAEAEGYTTYTVKYYTELGIKNILDLTQTDMTGPLAWSAPIFDICDYYSGMAGLANLMDENGNGEAVLSWQDTETKIYFAEKMDGGDMGYGEWIQESDTIVSTVFSAWDERTLEITVPDGYDGILLYIGRDGIEGVGKEACDAADELSGKTQLLLDSGNKAEDYYFIRLTDVVE